MSMEKGEIWMQRQMCLGWRNVNRLKEEAAIFKSKNPTCTVPGRNQPHWHLGFRILASGTTAVQFCGLSYLGCSSFYGSPSKLRHVWRVCFPWCSENSVMREQWALFSAQCMKEAPEHSSWGQTCGAGEESTLIKLCLFLFWRKKGRNAPGCSRSFCLNSTSEFAFSKLPISMSHLLGFSNSKLKTRAFLMLSGEVCVSNCFQGNKRGPGASFCFILCVGGLRPLWFHLNITLIIYISSIDCMPLVGINTCTFY